MSQAIDEQRRQRAEAQFKKNEQRAREASVVYDELRQKAEADLANMSRLRALRLAKEAGEKASPPVKEVPAAPRKPEPKRKLKTGS